MLFSQLREKAHLETEVRVQETHLQQEEQEQEDEEAQLKNRLQEAEEFQAVKKKRRERTSTNCPKQTPIGQVVMTPDPEPPENTQNELLENTEISSDLLSKDAHNVEQRPVSDAVCELSNSVNDNDSKQLFNTEMTVKSHEPLSLLLNIMQHHTEDKSKQQITKIGKLFAQDLKKPSKGTNVQPKIKNPTQSKIKATDLRSIVVPRKEEKKVNANNTKQTDHAAKSSLSSGSLSPNKQQHSKLILENSPEPKYKSKKNKKKKSDKGNSSIGKLVF